LAEGHFSDIVSALGHSLRYLAKCCLLAAVLLVFSPHLPAQRFISGGGLPSFGNGGFGGGYGGYGWGNYGWGNYGFGYSSTDFCLHHPQEHAPFDVGFAHGDPEFIQSTFMDYDQALALGKKILEEQAKPQPSLGEIARQLRQHRRQYVPAPVPAQRPSAVTRNPAEKFQIVEDRRGIPILCRESACALPL
jgi:hypothetical protein